MLSTNIHFIVTVLRYNYYDIRSYHIYVSTVLVAGRECWLVFVQTQ